MKTTRNILIISLVLLLSGAALAFAHGGWGGGRGGGYYGHMMGYGPGYGMGPGMMHGNGYGRGPGMYGYGPGTSLTPEQQQKLNDTQQKFFNETQKLRDQIRDGRYALNTEMSKQNPDSGKIAQLQKDLSALEGEFDQKALQNQLEVRKIVPDRFQNGPGYGYGPGCRW